MWLFTSIHKNKNNNSQVFFSEEVVEEGFFSPDVDAGNVESDKEGGVNVESVMPGREGR